MDKWTKFEVWADNDYCSYEQLPENANVLDSTLVEKVKVKTTKTDSKTATTSDESSKSRSKKEAVHLDKKFKCKTAKDYVMAISCDMENCPKYVDLDVWYMLMN